MIAGLDRTHYTHLRLLAVMLCLGCGSAPVTPTPAALATGVPSPAPAAPSAVETRDSCGGLTTLPRDDAARLLDDRVRIGLPRGTAQGAVPFDEVGMDVPTTLLERATLRLGDAALFVTAFELHRAAGDVLTEEAVLRAAAQRARVVALPGAPPGVLAVETDDEAVGTDHRLVELLRAYVRTSDALVVEVRFEAMRTVAALGGCDELARALAASLAPGARTIPRISGPRSLTGDLGITLQEDHVIMLVRGEGYGGARVVALTPLGTPAASLRVHWGVFARLVHPHGATSQRARILGRNVEWWTWQDADGAHREALVPTDHETLHLDVRAADAATAYALSAVATTLTGALPARIAPRCTPSTAGPLGDAPNPNGDDVRLLANAQRFTRTRVTLAEGDVPEALAFMRLLSREDARGVFLYLSSRGSAASKLYGLAGLAVVDRIALEAAYCAVRDELDLDVQVVGHCGVRRERASNVAFSADPRAITGEAHWGAEEWAAASDDHPVDVYGGAISWALAHGTPGETALEDAVRTLGNSAPPAHGTPLRAGEPLRVFPGAVRSGLCVMRTDGRVGCWGGVLAGEDIELAPDLVRHPLSYAQGASRTCMLDAVGQRTCMFDPTQERAILAEACGTDSSPRQVIRRYADGPFRELVHRSEDVCGLHADGSIRCFDASGVVHRVAAPGHIAGMSAREHAAFYAFAEEGFVYAIHGIEVRLVGQHAGIIALEAGYDGSIFVTLGDGRVLAYGEPRGDRRRPRAYYERGTGDGTWREVPELRGARIFAAQQHACALYPDGRVSCFGRGDNGERGVPLTWEEVPRDVPELRGASTLIVQEGATCGRFDAARLVCIGWNVPALALAPETRGALGPVTVDLDWVNQVPLPASPQNQSSASDRTSTGGR